jgi:hypothetical protein
MPIDHVAARRLLDKTLAEIADHVLQGRARATIPHELSAHCDAVFRSNTQAYRECLLGCVVARILDAAVDVHKPYMNQGPDAFNGRTLDERVVNPFFHDNRIPSSRGPYLSTFRRSVMFEPATRSGLRDKSGYDAMLACVNYAAIARLKQAQTFLEHLIYRFVELREASDVPLTRIQRFSLLQYEKLIEQLLSSASGGRFPVFLGVAAFRAISARFDLSWHVEHQGINVADGPSGVGGDVTISRDAELLMSAEVTERVVARDRVVSTFNTKIGPKGIDDYLFFVTQEPEERVKQQCHQYFAQGHEVSFVQIAQWLKNMLATIGKTGREQFNAELLVLLDQHETPQTVKAAWNSAVSSVIELA